MPSAASKPGPLLELRHVSRHFGGIAAVDGVDLDVFPGVLTALVGPNGAGKTTLFNVICGTTKASSGEIRFGGTRITSRRPDAIARAGIRRTFQNPRPLRAMSVLENAMLGADRHVGERLHRVFLTPWTSRSRERATRERAMEVLGIVRLDDKASVMAGTLSGGQRKLLELARALMSEPRLVLLDEPIAGVNPALREELITVIDKVHRTSSTTFLLIEHDLDFVRQLCDRVVVMDAGRIIADGSGDAIWSEPAVIEAYLGTAQ